VIIAVLDRPWWEVSLLGVAGLIVGGVIVLGCALTFDDWRTRRKNRKSEAVQASEREVKQMLSFPYYVDQEGLRALAGSLGIELPLAREVTKARKLSLTFKGLGGEGSDSVTSQLAGNIDLNRLAHELRFGRVADRVASGLGEAPYVSDEEILESAIDTIERSLGETSGTREALARVRETYEVARIESVSNSKREELKPAAESNSLIVLSGELDRASDDGGVLNKLRLVRFDPQPVYPDHASARFVVSYEDIEFMHRRQLDFFGGGGLRRRPATRDEAVVPPDIALEVVLPDDSALTPAGAERIGRGLPFYARVIAHSPSYDAESGSFVSSAYAVWGVTRL
jgi:hypothetical protein